MTRTAVGEDGPWTPFGTPRPLLRGGKPVGASDHRPVGAVRGLVAAYTAAGHTVAKHTVAAARLPAGGHALGVPLDDLFDESPPFR